MQLPIVQKKDLRDDEFANLSACERCIKDGGGCCTGEGSGIFVTMHDVLMIHKATKIPLNKIAVFKEVSEQHIIDIKKNDPFFYQLFKDGKVLQLIRKDGHCKFLQYDTGCTIFEHRPSLCRMFPFSFSVNESGEPKLEIPRAEKQRYEPCTILEENYYRSKGATLKAMNTNRKILDKLFRKHIKELEVYKLYVDDLAKGVSFKKIIKKHNIIV